MAKCATFFYCLISLFVLSTKAWGTPILTQFYHDLNSIKQLYIPGILNIHLRRPLLKIEKKYWNFLSGNNENAKLARKKLQFYFSQSQTPTKLSVEMPISDRPYWQRIEKQFANYQSTKIFPEHADIVIIGGGLTGTSVAYHLGKKIKEYYQKSILSPQKLNLFDQIGNDELKEKFKKAITLGQQDYNKYGDIDRAIKISILSGPTVTLLDTYDLVQQASGRNGGNIHSIPEVFFGHYENIVRERYKFIQKNWPSMTSDKISQLALLQAREIINMAKWTRKLIGEIPQQENFDADFSPGGWLRIARTQKEYEGLKFEQKLLEEANLPSTMYSPEQIEKNWHYKPAFGGRFTPKDATYHPYKFAMGLVNTSVDKFNLQIYTNTKVHNIGADLTLFTSKGKLQAKKVVIATNAFTQYLIDYKYIRPVLSQIMCTDFLPNKTKGSLVTENEGNIYYHQPKGSYSKFHSTDKLATLLMGGPDVALDDEMIKTDKYIYNMRPLQWVHEAILIHRNKVFPEFKNVPPSSEWAGPMGFTPDRIPAIGLYAPNVYIAAGFNGFGGTYTIGAGKSIAKLLLTGVSSSKVRLDVFDPHRFLHATLQTDLPKE